MANCVDQAYIEMIVRNVVAQLTQDHVVQMALKNCAGNWLGHESRVVECSELEGLVQDMIDNGDVTLPPDVDIKLTAARYEGNILVLTLSDGTEIRTATGAEVPADVHVTAARYEGGKLILTLSDGSEVETSNSMSSITPASAPAATTDCAIPTTIVGGTDQLLGRPVAFIMLEGKYKVPVYDIVDCP